MTEDKQPLDAYESEETLLADWQRTKEARKQRARIRVLTEAQRLVEVDLYGITDIDYGMPPLEELQNQVKDWPLRKVQKVIADIDSQITEHKGYRQRITQKIQDRAAIAWGPDRKEHAESNLKGKADDFDTVEKAIALLEEIRGVYATRLNDLVKLATPEKMKGFLERMTQLAKDGARQKEKIRRSLEAAACQANFEKTARLTRALIDLRLEYEGCKDALNLIRVDMSTPLPEFPTFNENTEVPYEVRRILTCP